MPLEWKQGRWGWQGHDSAGNVVADVASSAAFGDALTPHHCGWIHASYRVPGEWPTEQEAMHATDQAWDADTWKVPPRRPGTAST